MKKTAEQIAAELVTVERYDDTADNYFVALCGWPDGFRGHLNSKSKVERDASEVRDMLVAAMLLYAEEAIRPPISCGISPERLAEIRARLIIEENLYVNDRAPQSSVADHFEWLNDLLSHIDHLSAYLRIVATDDGIEAQDALYRRGFEDGLALRPAFQPATLPK